ncbi:MAG TPA: dTMP kinase [bacterium (Candidatus Stahlbacteria)]|nr:dTMP kinase [Candidatus Stahlbacteria bacterium]
MQGLFITFEGTEGSGKSTQAKRLYKWLCSLKYPCLFTHEPGGEEVSERIRKILLDRRMEIIPIAELFLYLAARAQHTTKVIRPALLQGKIVISDRFFDATMSYQGEGRGIPKKIIKEMNNFATGGLIPDITIIVDIPPEEGLLRLKGKTRDRIEAEDKEFHNRVRGGYLKIARENPQRVKVVDGRKPPDVIEEEIRKLVQPLIRRFK